MLTAEMVASRPITGKDAVNTKDFAQRIVYFDRGGISLRDKVRTTRVLRCIPRWSSYLRVGVVA
jgi:hypothetical protein